MNAAEVIKREPYSVGGFQVLPFLREPIGQARHAPHPHSYAQVSSLDMRGANSVKDGLSPLWDRHGVNDFGGRVPNFRLAGIGVDLNQLGKVHAGSQAGVNRVNIGPESVGGDLKTALRGLVDLLGKGEGIAGIAPAKVPSQEQFRIALDGGKAVGVSVLGIARCIVLFFAEDIAPDFITFHVRDRQVVDSAFQKPLALIPDQGEQGKNCGVVDSGEALDGTDGASFNEKLYDLGRVVQARIHATQRRSVVLGEGLAALLTAEALKAVAVFSKLLAAGIAVVAGHGSYLGRKVRPSMNPS